MQDLFYYPKIEKTREYTSDYSPQKKDDIVSIPLVSTDIIQDIIDKSEISAKITEDISENVSNVIDVMITAVKRIAEDIEIIDPNINENIEIDSLEFNPGNIPIDKDIIEEPINYNDFEIPEIDYTVPDFDIIIEDSDSIIEKMSEQYENNLANIGNDYVNKLYRVLEKYTYMLLVIRGDSGLFFNEEINAEVDCDNVTLKNQDLQPYLDYIGKSQIIKDQKMRLFKKTHSLDETLFHLKDVDTAFQQFKRYYAKEELEENNYVNSSCNEILKTMTTLSKKKLNLAQNDLYKYYNSSARIVEDYLNMQIKEIKCKALLLMNGENLYGQTE